MRRFIVKRAQGGKAIGQLLSRGIKEGAKFISKKAAPKKAVKAAPKKKAVKAAPKKPSSSMPPPPKKGPIMSGSNEAPRRKFSDAFKDFDNEYRRMTDPRGKINDSRLRSDAIRRRQLRDSGNPWNLDERVYKKGGKVKKAKNVRSLKKAMGGKCRGGCH